MIEHSHDFSSTVIKAQGSLLGAAVGDALGWPQEMPKKQVGKKNYKLLLSLDFQKWERRAGGQYRPHNEVILPGEYSDDTQLLLCTARSLLFNQQWWEHLTHRELPTWMQYERGGGGATLRAVRSWIDGQSPWSNRSLRQKYFEAGGNGVAMRILPHCLLGVFEQSFSKIAQNIVANGITTHGHPRAIVGALAYGFALWVALRETGALAYGKLIDTLLREISTWSPLPDIENISPDWKLAAREVYRGQYQKQWQTTVDEIQQLLEKSQDGIRQGSLSIDTNFLKEIGCFTKDSKGSGTITAIAAIFLASRYAADPSHGLLEAAFAHGADTDTLASMTGALLGAISGLDWLDGTADKVQDAEYLRLIGQRLIERDWLSHQDNSTQTKKANKASLTSLLDQIERLKPGEKIVLTDTREAELLDTYVHQSTAKAARARSWKFIADGQIIYLKKTWYEKSEIKEDEKGPSNAIIPEIFSDTKLSNESTPLSDPAPSSLNFNAELSPVEFVQTSVKLIVNDLQEAKFFYGKVLGLPHSKTSKTLEKYGSIWLMESKKSRDEANSLRKTSDHDTTPDVWIEVKSLEEAYENVCRAGLRIMKEIAERDESRYFLCRDPSGYLVCINEIQF